MNIQEFINLAKKQGVIGAPCEDWADLLLDPETTIEIRGPVEDVAVRVYWNVGDVHGGCMSILKVEK